MTTYLYLFIISFVWPLQTLPTLLLAIIALAFLGMLIQNRIVVRRVKKRLADTNFTGNMMEEAVKIGDNNVVRFIIRDKYIERLYGHLFPKQGLSAEEWKEHLHPDDKEATIGRFRRMMSGKVKRDEFFYRWNFNFEDGAPRWGYMHNNSIVEFLAGTSIPQSIISTLRDETELREQELHEEELTEKYKIIFEHNIVGLSFYSPEGWLLDANKIMREICHFDSDTYDEYFSNTNLFDAMPFNEILDRNNVEELWACVQSIVPERGLHEYLELHVYPLYDDSGKLLYIAIAVRNITGEREMYLQAKRNDIEIQRVSNEIMRYEEELRYMMEACDMRAFRLFFDERVVRFYKGLGTVEFEMSFDEIESHFINEPEMLRLGFQDPYTYFSQPMGYMVEMRPVFHDGHEIQWNQINNIPVYDENGKVKEIFGLIRNISSMMAKQEQLKRETERANDSGRLKSVFLANMTHEIRTPLNAIVGFTDLLQAIESPDDKRDMIRVIHNNCDMLLRLINDILLLSNVDANAMEILPQDVDFAKEFKESCKSLAQRVQEPGVEFQEDNPCETLPARLDMGRVHQVITNFVTNAVKYTHEGHIRVGYREEERKNRQGIYVYCEDTGTGIPKDQCERVFERFVKLNDYVQGTGLGLSICKALVEKCEGEIGVDSEVGKGSTFWFWIPKMLLLFALLFGWSVSDVQAAARPDTVRVFTEDHPLVYEDAWDLWPYAFLNDVGEPVGYNIDLLKLIFKELDIPFKIKLKPTKAALEDLKAGRADLMCGMDAHFHNEYGQYGKSVIQIFTHSVVHRKDEPVLIKTIEDLSRHRVIVHDGSFSHHLMIQQGWGSNAIPFNDMQDAVHRAHNEEGTQIVWNTLSLDWLLRKFHYNDLELTPVNIPHGEYKFMSNNPRLLAQLDSAYAYLSSMGRLQPIQNKWFYPEHKDTGIPSWVWYVVAVLLVLIISFLIYYIAFRLYEQRMTRNVHRSNNRLALILNTSQVHIWLFDVANRTVTNMNPGGKKATIPLSPYFFQYYILLEDYERLCSAIDEITSQRKEKETLKVRVTQGHGGEVYTFSVDFSVLRRNKSGRPSTMIVATTNITGDIHRRQKQKDAMLRYQHIFNSAMVDTVSYDENGFIDDMNEKASSAIPGGAQRVVDAHISIRDVLGDPDLSIENMDYTYLIQIYKSPDDPRILNKFLKRDEFYYELQLVPVRDDKGRLLAIYGTGRDVTELNKFYSRLQKNIAQLQEATDEMNNYIRNIDYIMQNGGVRIVTYSPDSHMLTVYSEIDRVQLRLTQTRLLSLATENSKKAAQRVLKSMDNRTKQPVKLSAKSTLRLRNGRQLSVYFSFVPVCDADGRVVDYFGMCRDISEIKAMEEQLALETQKAQEVETVKNAFLRNMSYEIRTPLTSVVGFAELFEHEHDADDEQFFIQEIRNNSEQLLKLINNILFLSRLDARMIEFKKEPVDFAAVFESCCQPVWVEHQQPDVSYSVDTPYERLVLDIDLQNLRMAIGQLVMNAVQYTTSGFVRACFDYNGEDLTITVQDTGRGIPAKRLDNIFGRFVTNGNSGSGLGLAICHEIVTQMGGRIRIKSEVGKGTIVWVIIPCTCKELVRKVS